MDFLTNSTGKEVPALVKQLNLFLDGDCILRSKGRMSKCIQYKYDVLNPVMLGKKHSLTNLMINEFHKKVQHLGLQSTINYMHTQGFWVPRARQTVKNIISKCVTCQKFNNFAFKYPKMTDMLKESVAFS
jgi:hypothetical protein